MDHDYDDEYDNEDADTYDSEDEDGFDYDEFVASEFGGSSDRSGGGLTNRNTKFIWRLTAIVLLILFLLSFI